MRIFRILGEAGEAGEVIGTVIETLDGAGNIERSTFYNPEGVQTQTVENEGINFQGIDGYANNQELIEGSTPFIIGDRLAGIMTPNNEILSTLHVPSNEYIVFKTVVDGDYLLRNDGAAYEDDPATGAFKAIPKLYNTYNDYPEYVTISTGDDDPNPKHYHKQYDEHGNSLLAVEVSADIVKEKLATLQKDTKKAMDHLKTLLGDNVVVEDNGELSLNEEKWPQFHARDETGIKQYDVLSSLVDGYNAMLNSLSIGIKTDMTTDQPVEEGSGQTSYDLYSSTEDSVSVEDSVEIDYANLDLSDVTNIFELNDAINDKIDEIGDLISSSEALYAELKSDEKTQTKVFPVGFGAKNVGVGVAHYGSAAVVGVLASSALIYTIFVMDEAVLREAIGDELMKLVTELKVVLDVDKLDLSSLSPEKIMELAGPQMAAVAAISTVAVGGLAALLIGCVRTIVEAGKNINPDPIETKFLNDIVSKTSHITYDITGHIDQINLGPDGQLTIFEKLLEEANKFKRDGDGLEI